MAFPQDPLAIRGEMQINGTWTNITSDIREDQGIAIRGGLTPEQSTLSPSTINFKLNNRSGKYTDDNIASPYYNLLPSNTPFRVSVLESSPFLKLYNRVEDDITNVTWLWDYVQTADKASLDVTGDLDLRIEIDPEVWTLGSVGHQLAAKYSTSTNSRSWAWVIQPNGTLKFYWTTDGLSGTLTSAESTAKVPATGRIALRMTIDVDNGASGRTITFYTSTSITGTWTQLGSQVIQSGTTSIYSGSAGLTVGAVIDSATGRTTFVTDATLGRTFPLVGRVHRFQMYSGIAGTLVADMNPAGQAEGTTSWSDGLASANTWLTQNTAEITKADYRGFGEIAEMPQEWDVTGTDIYVPVSANGILRRLTQGSSALRSAIFRNLSRYIGAGATDYWPLEGGSQTTAAGNAVPFGRAAAVNNVLFTTDSAIGGSAGVMTLNDANSYIRADGVTTAPANQMFAIYYIKVPSAPASLKSLVNVYTTGTIRRITIGISNITYQIDGYAADGTSLFSTNSSFGTGAAPGQWLAFQLKLTKNGTGVDVALGWYPLGTRQYFYGFNAPTVASAVVGAPSAFYTAPDAGTLGASFAHIMMGNLAGWEFATLTFANSSVGYDGETTGARWLRICKEEGVKGRLVGWLDDCERMGPQPLATFSAILDECAQIEGGVQYEAKDQAALVFRTRRSLYGQDALSLTYARPTSHLAGSFRPVDDDLLTKNRVTVSRPTGSFAVYEKKSGKKSTQAPPNGVGVYDVPLTRNAYTDARLVQLASWEVGKGTWPQRRVPNIEVWLQRPVFASNATLTRQMRSILPGSRLQILSPPVWVGGSTLDTLIRGFSERLLNRGHELAFSSVPYGPYDVGRFDSTTLPAATPIRWDVRTSTLAAGISSSATLAASVTTSRLGFWSWKSCPYNVKIAGQVNTVIGATRPDSISVVDTSFEAGVTGYAVSGGTSTLAASTAQKPFGTQSALMTVAGSPGTAAVIESTGAAASAGGSYQCQVWVRCSAARNVGVKIEWYSSVPTLLSTSSLNVAVAANTWTEISITATAPASTATAKPGVFLDSSPANGTTLYFKNLDLMRLDSRNNRQLLTLTRGIDGVTKALGSGEQIHIYPQKAWAL